MISEKHSSHCSRALKLVMLVENRNEDVSSLTTFVHHCKCELPHFVQNILWIKLHLSLP